MLSVPICVYRILEFGLAFGLTEITPPSTI